MTFIAKKLEEYRKGDFIPYAPADWNEDNIEGYNYFKQDYESFLHTALLEMLDEIERGFPDSTNGILCASCRTHVLERLKSLREIKP